MPNPISMLATPQLGRIFAAFAEEGEEIRYVGGCVRDALLGATPKDIDLGTTADLQRQLEIYAKHGFKSHLTGIEHGTITVHVENVNYEITSYRREVAHDGRRATVEYTRDLAEDLGRRDLTINAMACDAEGQIFDPFGGREDLEAARVRFVGNPVDRIREDHLRILRFIRFHFRYAFGQPLDEAAADAIRTQGKSLEKISAERIWSEVARFIAGQGGGEAMREMMRLGIAYPSRLPHGSWREVKRVHVHTRDPVTLMVAFLGDPARIEKLAERWRWSAAERERGIWLAENLPHDDLDYRRLVARHNKPVSLVKELACLHERAHEGRALDAWVVPEFPIRGRDIVAAGVPEGPEVGFGARMLKDAWADSGYTLTRDELLGMLKRD
jgi:tRNA nucleotidyltransferase/poly(A) polymerase